LKGLGISGDSWETGGSRETTGIEVIRVIGVVGNLVDLVDLVDLRDLIEPQED